MNIFQKINTNEKYRKIIISVILTKLALIFIASFNQMVSPHIHRQVDTLGVAMRYWLKMTHESFSLETILPAVINSGSGNGITPMEFPIINLLLAPFFIGSDLINIPIVTLVFVVLTIILWRLSYKSWDGIQIGKVEVRNVILWMPILSLTSIYTGKFIPDTIALFLILIGVGRSWDKPKIESVLYASVALLIKPVLVIGFGLFLYKDIKEVVIRYWYIWFVPILVALIYYTLGVAFITEHGSMNLFAIEVRGLSKGLLNFVKHSYKFPKLLNEMLFIRFASIIVFPFIIIKLFKRDSFVIRSLMILSLQLLSIAIIGGKEVYAHDYYFLGMVPILLLLSFSVLNKINNKLVVLVLIIFTFRTLEAFYSDSKPIFSSKKRHWRITEQCRQLKSENKNFPWNKNEVFRTSNEGYPLLAICLRERVGSTSSKYGVLYATDGIPEGCREIKRYKDIKAIECE